MNYLKKVLYRLKGFVFTRSLKNRKVRIIGKYPLISDLGSIKIGRGVTFKNRTRRTRLSVSEGGCIYIGDNVFLNEGCNIHAAHSISIGSGCKIGENVQILDTSFHAVNLDSEVKIAPIQIESGVWIANNVIILPGVRIGHNSVIGSGSVVSKNFDPYSLIVGNPAILKKKLI